jgi:VWFA-related protein
MDSIAKHIPAVALLAVAAVASASAQAGPAPTTSAPQTDSSQGTLVKVWVIALDAGGRRVLNLGKEDLKLYEDNVERQVIGLAAKDSERMTVRLRIDASMKHRLPFFRPQLSGSNKLLRPVLDSGGFAFVAAFGNRLIFDPPTSDLRLLEDSVDKVAGIWLGGKTALYDAIDTLCQSNFPQGRKALVVVSDADDTAIQHVRGDALGIAELTRTHVFFLFTVEGRMERFVDNQAWMLEARDSAQRLSSSTGGKAYRVHNEAGTDQAFGEIGGYLASEYAVTFYSAGSGPHKVKVQSVRRGVRILSQKDYPAPQNRPLIKNRTIPSLVNLGAG